MDKWHLQTSVSPVYTSILHFSTNSSQSEFHEDLGTMTQFLKKFQRNMALMQLFN